MHFQIFVQFEEFVKEVASFSKDLEEDEWLNEEIKNIERQIRDVEIEKAAIRYRRELWSIQMNKYRNIEDIVSQEYNHLVFREKELIDEVTSLNEESLQVKEFLEKLMQINVVNDAFHIWYTGPYGTINNFRLGSLPVKPIDHNEVNAALGQVALVIHTLAEKAGVKFKSFIISPLGNNPKIMKADDRRTMYPLFLDPTSFSFFPKRNFNLALSGFMSCVLELGDYVANYDPTMSMPYKIDLIESKIGEISFVYGVDDEVWTRALKFTLSNVKWIIAWYTKHGNNISSKQE